jgi:DNA-binding transcriptional LysR family regulator
MVKLRDEAVQALEQFRGNLTGHLLLGASSIPGTYLLPKFVAAFKVLHPAILITLRISDTSDVANQVIQGDVEAGIVGSAWNDRRVECEEVFSDELLLVVPPQHAWAEKRKIDIQELGGEPFILREKGSGTRMVMTRSLEQNGFPASGLDVVAEMGGTEAVRQGVLAGIGVSILSRHAVADDLERGVLVSVKIGEIRFVRPLYVVRRRSKQMSPLCAAFLDHLLSTAKGSAGT